MFNRREVCGKCSTVKMYFACTGKQTKNSCAKIDFISWLRLII